MKMSFPCNSNAHPESLAPYHLSQTFGDGSWRFPHDCPVPLRHKSPERKMTDNHPEALKSTEERGEAAPPSEAAEAGPGSAAVVVKEAMVQAPSEVEPMDRARLVSTAGGPGSGAWGACSALGGRCGGVTAAMMSCGGAGGAHQGSPGGILTGNHWASFLLAQVGIGSLISSGGGRQRAAEIIKRRL